MKVRSMFVFQYASLSFIGTVLPFLMSSSFLGTVKVKEETVYTADFFADWASVKMCLFTV